MNINESNATKEEVESSPEQAAANDDDTDTAGAGAGTGARSYECMFCKRGFSTAQALGGHMNIHRRDRNRIGKSSTPLAAASASSKRPDYNVVAGRYHPYPVHKVRSSTSNSCSSDYVPMTSYGSFSTQGYTASTSSFNIKNDCLHHRPRELSLFDQDQDQLQLGLGLMHGDKLGKRVEVEKEKGDGEEKLDLELRLGRDPLKPN